MRHDTLTHSLARQNQDEEEELRLLLGYQPFFDDKRSVDYGPLHVAQTSLKTSKLFSLRFASRAAVSSPASKGCARETLQARSISAQGESKSKVAGKAEG